MVFSWFGHQWSIFYYLFSLHVTTSIYPVPSICSQDQISDWFASLAECLHWNVRKKQKHFDELSDLTRSSSDDTLDSKESWFFMMGPKTKSLKKFNLTVRVPPIFEKFSDQVHNWIKAGLQSILFISIAMLFAILNWKCIAILPSYNFGPIRNFIWEFFKNKGNSSNCGFPACFYDTLYFKHFFNRRVYVLHFSSPPSQKCQFFFLKFKLWWLIKVWLCMYSTMIFLYKMISNLPHFMNHVTWMTDSTHINKHLLKIHTNN